jgi:hypothetical protein
MGNNKKPSTTSRRGFFSRMLTGKNSDAAGKVKMLTADGRLVEIDKSVLEQAALNRKATNKEIFDWMKNPSKKQDKD